MEGNIEELIREQLERTNRATDQAPITMEKLVKRFSWITAVVSLVIALSGAMTAVAVSQHKTESTFVSIEQKAEEVEARGLKNEEAIIQNRSDIRAIRTDIVNVASQITDAAAGVKRLEAEIQTARERRLTDEIERLKERLNR